MLGRPVVPAHLGQFEGTTNESDWFELYWESPIPNELPYGHTASLFVCEEGVLTSHFANRGPTARYVATFGTHVWAKSTAPDIPTALVDRLPRELVVLDEVVNAPFDFLELLRMTRKALATLCELGTAGDERVLEHLDLALRPLDGRNLGRVWLYP